MQHLQSILVAVHPGEPNIPLLEQAMALARANQARVTVMHTVSEYPEDLSEWWNVRDPERLKAKLVEERQGVLDDMAERLRQGGVERVETRLRWGNAFLGVTHEVLRERHDLVMITSLRRGKLARILLECPSRDLLRHCPCTLWISQGRSEPNHHRVLAALGGRETSVVCDAMNTKVLRHAAAIAQGSGSQLHVVHAIPVYGGKGLKKGGRLRSDLEEHLGRAKEDLIAACTEVLKDYDVSLDSKRIYLRPGGRAEVITSVVEERGIDQVVMGMTAPEGFRSLLMSSVTVRVFDALPCDLVAVKPDDFVSMVELEEQARSSRTDAEKSRSMGGK